MLKNSCNNLHCQKGFNVIIFLYKIRCLASSAGRSNTSTPQTAGGSTEWRTRRKLTTRRKWRARRQRLQGQEKGSKGAAKRRTWRQCAMPFCETTRACTPSTEREREREKARALAPPPCQREAGPLLFVNLEIGHTSPDSPEMVTYPSTCQRGT